MVHQRSQLEVGPGKGASQSGGDGFFGHGPLQAGWGVDLIKAAIEDSPSLTFIGRE